ncbi:unnamed protein product [Pleuronectes platessa]|uniref:Uncharacterized protein n=1 Tax=Pleuronectes platessa TaxID=8262 RepID=A0A9N7VGB4_PLEPL|nr:unnamed protein product [Pleuronectes platessa]
MDSNTDRWCASRSHPLTELHSVARLFAHVKTCEGKRHHQPSHSNSTCNRVQTAPTTAPPPLLADSHPSRRKATAKKRRVKRSCSGSVDDLALVCVEDFWLLWVVHHHLAGGLSVVLEEAQLPRGVQPRVLNFSSPQLQAQPPACRISPHAPHLAPLLMGGPPLSVQCRDLMDRIIRADCLLVLIGYHT